MKLNPVFGAGPNNQELGPGPIVKITKKSERINNWNVFTLFEYN